MGEVRPLNIDPGVHLIGRTVQRYWYEEGKWFDALVTDYDHTTKQHCVTYEVGQESETYEWVNLHELPKEECIITSIPAIDVSLLPMPPSANGGSRGGGVYQAPVSPPRGVGWTGRRRDPADQNLFVCLQASGHVTRGGNKRPRGGNESILSEARVGWEPQSPVAPSLLA